MRDLRQGKRYAIDWRVRLMQDGRDLPARMTDISLQGAQLSMAALSASSLRIAPLTLTLDEIGEVGATVQWASAGRCGVSFDLNPDQSEQLKRKLAGLAAPASAEIIAGERLSSTG